MKQVVLIVIMFLACVYVKAQTPNPDCDALCQEQKRLENLRLEYEKQLREIEYQKAKIQSRRVENVRVEFQKDSELMLKEEARLKYEHDLRVANSEKVLNEQKAELVSRFKGKWEATFPKEVIEKCSEVCPPAKY